MFRLFGNFLLENFRLVWARLTLSRITIAYVVFTVLHCCVQVGLQSEAFVLNGRADGFLKSIVSAAGLPVPRGINILVKDGPLYICDDTPNLADCTMIWSPKSANDSGVSTTSVSGYSSSSYYAGDYYASPTGTAASGAAIVVSSASAAVPSSTAVASTTTPATSSLSAPTSITSPPSITPSPPAPLSSVSKDSEAVVTSTQVITITTTSPVPTASTRPAFDDDDDELEELSSTGIFLPFIAALRGAALPTDDISSPAKGSEDIMLPDWRVRRRNVARPLRRRSLKVGTAAFDSNGTLEFVPVSGFSPAKLPAAVTPGSSSQSSASDPGPGVADLPPACVRVLAWPLQNLATSGREDIVFLAFNIWALGMSFVAVLNESMPHMIAAVMTHILLTSWTGFQLIATERFRIEFLRITKNGACQGINLLPVYWEERRSIELAELILNILSLVGSVFLSWRLVKQFGWQTFKRVGASLSVNHMYKLVLGLSVVLQLAMFFIVSSMALWIEQICNGPAQFIVDHKVAYEVLYLVIIILLVPWAASGWFGVRRESKELTMVFLIGAVSVITSWGGMFFSHTFRLLFATWGFFAMLAIIAMILSGIILVLGIACRLKFGKNAKKLANYLKPDEESVIENRDLTRDFGFGYGEKVEFPGGGVPTYDSIMKGGMTPTSLPPLTIPVGAHTNPSTRASSRSPFSSRSSSPSRADSYDYDSRSGYAPSTLAHSRSSSAASSAPYERASTKKAWVIE